MRKVPTIKDIAGALGMHKSTVSLALSGKGTLSSATRLRVAAAAREMGYEPNLHAQRLAYRQASDTICIVSGVLDVGLATEKALRLQKALNVHTQEAPIYTSSHPMGESGEAQAARIRQICRQRPRAIICAAQRVHPMVFRELAAYQQSGGIVVTYDTPVPLECDQVIFDREDNAYRAAKHLLEHGHRQIGIGMSEANELLRWAGQENRLDPQAHRLRGFRRALTEYGLSLSEKWFFQNST